MNFGSILRRPSAFLPLGMSLAALTTIAVHVALFGTARREDEGTAAHIWQLLVALQVPIICVFAVSWLPRNPRQALLILGLQIVGVLAALAPVFLLGF